MPRLSSSAIRPAMVMILFRRRSPPECGGHGRANQPRISPQNSFGLWHDTEKRKRKSCLEQGPGNRSDLAFPGFLALGMTRGIAAKPKCESRLALIVSERHEQVFRVQI